MNKKERAELIELLKTGNFTVASHDHGQVSIYKGKYTGYNSKEEMPEFPEDRKDEVFDSNKTEGYMPEIVELLTEALGGSNGGSA